jgi:hypothetical protein
VIAQSVENLYALGGVAPRGSMRYEWFVPDTAGPGSRDGPVVVYAYVSGVDHIKHINAGASSAAGCKRVGMAALPSCSAYKRSFRGLEILP